MSCGQSHAVTVVLAVVMYVVRQRAPLATTRAMALKHVIVQRVKSGSVRATALVYVLPQRAQSATVRAKTTMPVWR